jgi:hypothetical protein
MMTTIKRETVGKISSDLLNKTPITNDPIEIERAMHGDYLKNMLSCIDDASDEFGNAYFIVVLTKRERLMSNVLRNYFFARSTCPTPDYDQTVYLYKKDADCLDFIWVIPSKDTCIYLKNNALSVVEEEKQLLRFVLDFADGTLYKLAKKLNNEVDDSSELVQ